MSTACWIAGQQFLRDRTAGSVCSVGGKNWSTALSPPREVRSHHLHISPVHSRTHALILWRFWQHRRSCASMGLSKLRPRSTSFPPAVPPPPRTPGFGVCFPRDHALKLRKHNRLCIRAVRVLLPTSNCATGCEYDVLGHASQYISSAKHGICTYLCLRCCHAHSLRVPLLLPSTSTWVMHTQGRNVRTGMTIFSRHSPVNLMQHLLLRVAKDKSRRPP
ncbi:hypothetical protein C8Q80DRAFT_783202 [Daedaleopsis nitida]|nr:hypothetical protein C8Q80DRAFT_783202 [Daedaleopsis nitida]